MYNYYILVLNLLAIKFKIYIIDYKELYFELIIKFYGNNDLSEYSLPFLFSLFDISLQYIELKDIVTNSLNSIYKKCINNSDILNLNRDSNNQDGVLVVLKIVKIYNKLLSKDNISECDIKNIISLIRIIYGIASTNNSLNKIQNNYFFIENRIIELLINYICSLKEKNDELLIMHLKTITEFAKGNNKITIYIDSLFESCFTKVITEDFEIVVDKKLNQLFEPYLLLFIELCNVPYLSLKFYESGITNCIDKIIKMKIENEKLYITLMKFIMNLYRCEYCYKYFSLYYLSSLIELFKYGLQHSSFEYMDLILRLFVLSSEQPQQIVELLVKGEDIIPVIIKHSSYNNQVGNYSRQILNNIIGLRSISSYYSIYYISNSLLFNLLDCSDPNVVTYALYVINDRFDRSTLPDYENMNDDIILYIIYYI